MLLSAELSAGALIAATRLAREAGALVAFDLNLRPNLFDGAEALRRGLRQLLPLLHVVKPGSHTEMVVPRPSPPPSRPGCARRAARRCRG